jgi:hypothetical protein
MDTVETVMAEQLDGIIRRLSTRIDAEAEATHGRSRAVGKMKKNLGRVKSIRDHFDQVK